MADQKTIAAPANLRDASRLLTGQGFATSDTWYHGTSSALVESIRQYGLKRSGDREMQAATKQTMATIGNAYAETPEPIYLTQSSELAYYWATQTVRERDVRVGGDNQPVVLAVQLPASLNDQVKPDVGAASLLLVKAGEDFMAYLAGIYQAQGLAAPDIDLMKADRMEYLDTLGMAYLDTDIDAACVTLLADEAQ